MGIVSKSFWETIYMYLLMHIHKIQKQAMQEKMNLKRPYVVHFSKTYLI